MLSIKGVTLGASLAQRGMALFEGNQSADGQESASLIEAMMAKLRADRPGITIDLATSNDTEVWQAIVSAGFADGAWPKWQATGASRSEAIENALQTACDYWALRGDRPGG